MRLLYYLLISLFRNVETDMKKKRYDWERLNDTK